MVQGLWALPSTLFLMVLLRLSSQSSSAASSSKPPYFQHVKLLDLPALEDVQNSESLSVIYYCTKNLQNSAAFFEEFETSAKLLEAYSVTLAIFDCQSNVKKHEKCSETDVERYIYTYQNGVELLALEIETMFDVNSIMSNSLQLVLLQEVPIIQSRLERQGLEKSYAGSDDLVFAYPQAVGTPEHRIFMEIAYTFQDKYKFALTTEFKSIFGLQGSENIPLSVSFALWILFCSESSVEEVARDGNCRSVLYRGESTLSAVASFMKRLSGQTVFHAPRDGTSSLFHLDDSLPTIYLYLDKGDDEMFGDLINMLSFDIKGSARMVIVDMSDEECKLEATKQSWERNLPGLSVKTDSDSISFMDPDEEWDISNIENFLFPYIFPEEAGEGEEDDTTPQDLEAVSDDSNLIQNVETQDDQVAKAVFGNIGKKLNSVAVPSLLKSSFDRSIKDSDLKIVLFYLPFDAVSMAFLLDFDQARNTLVEEFPDKDIVVRVNCFDASDLCGIQNITTYPLLRIFQKGKSPQLYEGPLDAQSIIKAAKLLMLNGPIPLETEEELEGFVRGEFPQNLSQFISTSVLLVAGPKDASAIEILDSASKQLTVFDVMGTVKESLLSFVSDKYEVVVPSVICFNRKDAIKPIKMLDSLADASTVVKFVKQAAIPTMPELGVANFPELYALRRPFVILFMDTTDPESDDAKKVVTQAASMFDDAIFCWMDAQVKSVGLQLLSEYTWTATLPMVTVVDHPQRKVFNFQSKPLIKKEFTDWLMDTFTGKQEPSKLLPEKKWEAPGQHYDFLAMIDEEKNKARSKSSLSGGKEEFDETLKRAEESVASGSEDGKEYLKNENEIREELLELRKSRLYQYPELKQKEVLFEESEGQGQTDQKEKHETETYLHEHAEL